MPKCDTSRIDRKNKEKNKKGKDYGSSKHIRNKEAMMEKRTNHKSVSASSIST